MSCNFQVTVLIDLTFTFCIVILRNTPGMKMFSWVRVRTANNNINRVSTSTIVFFHLSRFNLYFFQFGYIISLQGWIISMAILTDTVTKGVTSFDIRPFECDTSSLRVKWLYDWRDTFVVTSVVRALWPCDQRRDRNKISVGGGGWMQINTLLTVPLHTKKTLIWTQHWIGLPTEYITRALPLGRRMLTKELYSSIRSAW